MTAQIVKTSIPVHELFTSTIQGEGRWAGALSDFIRLHGCPVGCLFCDSLYSPADGGGKNAPREVRSIESVLAEFKSPRVVITGGEPFIQPHLNDLIDQILSAGRAVSIETSGAFYQPIDPAAWVTLSPKMQTSPLYPVKPQMWSRANEVKIIVVDGSELDFYEPYIRGLEAELFFQPEWGDRANTLPLAMELLKRAAEMGHSFRLSLQTHKMIGMQ